MGHLGPTRFQRPGERFFHPVRLCTHSAAIGRIDLSQLAENRGDSAILPAEVGDPYTLESLAITSLSHGGHGLGLEFLQSNDQGVVIAHTV